MASARVKKQFNMLPINVFMASAVAKFIFSSIRSAVMAFNVFINSVARAG